MTNKYIEKFEKKFPLDNLQAYEFREEIKAFILSEFSSYTTTLLSEVEKRKENFLEVWVNAGDSEEKTARMIWGAAIEDIINLIKSV